MMQLRALGEYYSTELFCEICRAICAKLLLKLSVYVQLLAVLNQGSYQRFSRTAFSQLHSE